MALYHQVNTLKQNYDLTASDADKAENEKIFALMDEIEVKIFDIFV